MEMTPMMRPLGPGSAQVAPPLYIPRGCTPVTKPPTLSLASEAAPAASRAWSTSRWPFSHAHIRAEEPSCGKRIFNAMHHHHELSCRLGECTPHSKLFFTPSPLLQKPYPPCIPMTPLTTLLLASVSAPAINRALTTLRLPSRLASMRHWLTASHGTIMGCDALCLIA